MAVNIKIKQNPDFPVALTIPEIAALKQLEYGVSANNIRSVLCRRRNRVRSTDFSSYTALPD